MDDQLDNELKKRITEVFENYEDTSADDGWLKLREKFPEEKKRRVAAWYWAGMAAALLLLFLGILWFTTSETNNQLQLGNKKPALKHQAEPATQIATNAGKANTDSLHNASITRQAAAMNDTEQAAAQKTSKPATQITANDKQEAIAATPQQNTTVRKNSRLENGQTGRSAPVKTETIAATQSTSKGAKQSGLQISAPAKAAIIAGVQPQNNASAPAGLQNPVKGQVDSAVRVQSQAVVANQPGIDMRSEAKNKAQVSKTIDEMFEQDKRATNRKEKKTSKEDKIINLGVYAATYFNYAKGSSNQFNLGAGITSDVKLTRNLKLSTGVSVGQNSLTYAGQPPQQSNLSYNSIAAATTSNFSPAKMLYTASAPTFKDYSANLVGLDIPLNLKFVFDPQKSGTYILAGVSSGTFINETYTYSYSTPSLYSANVSQVQNQSTKDSFNGFYFAKTLNLAFGTGYTIGRSQLMVEPFIKYPLDGLGSQQLKFGAGGVNLKFNFQVKKK